MDEYTCTVSVCSYGWHELCLIYVPRHGSLFDAVHAVVAGHYEIIYRGTVLVTRRMTPVGLGMSMYEPNQVVIRYDSVIDYSTMSDNTDSEEDVM